MFIAHNLFLIVIWGGWAHKEHSRLRWANFFLFFLSLKILLPMFNMAFHSLLLVILFRCISENRVVSDEIKTTSWLYIFDSSAYLEQINFDFFQPHHLLMVFACVRSLASIFIRYLFYRNFSSKLLNFHVNNNIFFWFVGESYIGITI